MPFSEFPRMSGTTPILAAPSPQSWRTFSIGPTPSGSALALSSARAQTFCRSETSDSCSCLLGPLCCCRCFFGVQSCVTFFASPIEREIRESFCFSFKIEAGFLSLSLQHNNSTLDIFFPIFASLLSDSLLANISSLK